VTLSEEQLPVELKYMAYYCAQAVDVKLNAEKKLDFICIHDQKLEQFR
jgi:hypothetical protein